MKYNLLKLLLLSLIFTSCASYNYDNLTAKKNRSIEIKSNIGNRFVVATKSDSKILADGSGQINTQLPNLKKKNLTLLIISNNYDTIVHKVKRTPRTDVLVKDICLGVLPLFIDLFNSDFYHISKKSKSINVHFEFSQSYMAAEFNRIRFSHDPRDFENWIRIYSKSKLLDSAIQLKDSLELSNALRQRSEDAISSFIYSHPKSRYLIKANEIYKAMIESRQQFEIVKSKNTVDGFEGFLEKYPNSLQNIEAHTSIVRLTEKTAIKSGSIGKMIEYLNEYFIPHSSYLYDFEQNNRAWSITKAIENQLIIDNKIKYSYDSYESFSALWKTCKEIRLAVPPSCLRAFEKIDSNRTPIFKLIFPLLQKNTSIGQQKLLIEKINVDFPNMTNGMSNRELIISVIESAITKSGLLKVWDVGYLPYLFKNKKIIYPDLLAGREAYYWNGTYMGSLTNFAVNYEELSFLNGEIFGVTNCYVDNEIIFSFDIGKDGPKEISYYHGGALAKKTYFQLDDIDHNSYDYEFVNGENITLSNYQSAINNLNILANSGDFEKAIYALEGLRKNNFPRTSQINLNIDKSLASAIVRRDRYNEQLENQRLAAQKDSVLAAQKLSVKESTSIEGGILGDVKSALIRQMELDFQRALSGEDDDDDSYVPRSSNRSNNTSNSCTKCAGSGYINCYQCNGTTQVECRTCFGKGRSWEYGSHDGKANLCGQCGGHGRRPCRACSSLHKGRQECPNCNGTGKRR